MVKDNFDRGELKHELKHAGFQDCIVEDIAERVNDRKTGNWTRTDGNKEAVREIEMFINRAKQSFDNFKQSNMPTKETMTTTTP